MKKIFYILAVFCYLQTSAQDLKDCSTCQTQIIKPENIKDLSIDEIRLLTNEIFARNGHQFENGRFQNFFEAKSWYKSKNGNKSVVFNEIEKKNIKLFQDKTKELKNNQQELVKQIKIFKNNVLQNDNMNLQKSFNYKAEDKYDTEYLLEVMKRIDLDNINWYKNVGIHKILVDNGFVIIEYSITIENEKISILYNFMNNSEIIKELDIYTDYQSEGEHLYNWQFEYKNNKMNFIRLVVAG